MKLKDIDRIAIGKVCRRHGIRKLSIFGSIVHDILRPDSDIDILVDFWPGVKVGFDIFDIEDELSPIFGGRRIDVVRVDCLNQRLRERIKLESLEQYIER
jgi:uncharacterized protein